MAKKSGVSLYDINAMGPEGLTISATTRNENDIAAWWERVKLYAEAMRGLDRVVMLCYSPEDNDYYLASVEEKPNA